MFSVRLQPPPLFFVVFSYSTSLNLFFGNCICVYNVSWPSHFQVSLVLSLEPSSTLPAHLHVLFLFSVTHGIQLVLPALAWVLSYPLECGHSTVVAPLKKMIPHSLAGTTGLQPLNLGSSLVSPSHSCWMLTGLIWVPWAHPVRSQHPWSLILSTLASDVSLCGCCPLQKRLLWLRLRALLLYGHKDKCLEGSLLGPMVSPSL